VKWRGLVAGLTRIKEEYHTEERICTEGSRAVVISGCEQILGYGTESVRLRTEESEVEVLGSDLTMRTFRGDIVVVEGRWQSITRKEREG